MDNSNWQQSQGAEDSYQGTGQGSTYDSMQGGQQQQSDMGGGQGAFGSGVAGGYGGNNSQSQQNPQGQNQNQGQGQGQTGEKQDWLDKGIESLGAKFGHNVSASQADSAGDFVNKEFNKYSGRNLPGVQ